MSPYNERGISPDHYIHPKDGLLPPAVMAQSTSQVLDFYFRDAHVDLRPGIGFLQRQTIPFLDGAERGLSRSFQDIARKRTMSMDDMDAMFDLTKNDHAPNPDDAAAFDFTNIVFGILPDQATDPRLPNGFSRVGIFAPPFTVAEHLDRVREIKTVIHHVASGTVPRGVEPTANASVWRTDQFFRVAKTLPDMFKNNPRLIQDKRREAFNRLLGDTLDQVF